MMDTKEQLAELIVKVDMALYDAQVAVDVLKDFCSRISGEEHVVEITPQQPQQQPEQPDKPITTLQEEKKPITTLQAREAFSAFVKDYGKEEAINLLKLFEAKKFTDIKASDYEVLLKRIEQYGNK